MNTLEWDNDKTPEMPKNPFFVLADSLENITQTNSGTICWIDVYNQVLYAKGLLCGKQELPRNLEKRNISLAMKHIVLNILLNDPTQGVGLEKNTMQKHWLNMAVFFFRFSEYELEEMIQNIDEQTRSEVRNLYSSIQKAAATKQTIVNSLIDYKKYLQQRRKQPLAFGIREMIWVILTRFDQLLKKERNPEEEEEKECIDAIIEICLDTQEEILIADMPDTFAGIGEFVEWDDSLQEKHSVEDLPWKAVAQNTRELGWQSSLISTQGITDGLSYKANEDFATISIKPNSDSMMLLCDGMGGQGGGKLAALTVNIFFKRWFENTEISSQQYEEGIKCVYQIVQLLQNIKNRTEYDFLLTPSKNFPNLGEDRKKMLMAYQEQLSPAARNIFDSLPEPEREILGATIEAASKTYLGLSQMATTFVIAFRNQNQLTMYAGGDSKVILIDPEKKEMIWASKDEFEKKLESSYPKKLSDSDNPEYAKNTKEQRMMLFAPDRNIVKGGIGIETEVSAMITSQHQLELSPGQKVWILQMSDGITDNIAENDMGRIIQDAKNPEEVCHALYEFLFTIQDGAMILQNLCSEPSSLNDKDYWPLWEVINSSTFTTTLEQLKTLQNQYAQKVPLFISRWKEKFSQIKIKKEYLFQNMPGSSPDGTDEWNQLFADAEMSSFAQEWGEWFFALDKNQWNQFYKILQEVPLEKILPLYQASSYNLPPLRLKRDHTTLQCAECVGFEITKMPDK